MTDPDEALTRLLARLEKELARQDVGTAAVGGMTKLGACLEVLLRRCFRKACELHGVEPAQILGQARGSGDYLRALSELGQPRGGDALLNAVIADAAGYPRRLGKLTRLRNFVTHEGAIPPEAKRLLRDVHGWLQSLR
jgi:hypothetical protein